MYPIGIDGEVNEGGEGKHTFKLLKCWFKAIVYSEEIAIRKIKVMFTNARGILIVAAN